MLKSWSKEEIACLGEAIHHKVQLKVISNQLGRTVSGISKIVNRYGLRQISPHPKKEEGTKVKLTLEEKWELDVQKMEELIAHHLGTSLKSSHSLPSKEQSSLRILEEQDLAHGPIIPQGPFDHAPISWDIAMTWARQAGLKFEETFLSPYHSKPVYGVGGRLASQTEIIMHINETRITKGLRPFFITDVCGE